MDSWSRVARIFATPWSWDAQGTTVVWGSKSRHWQLKAYCKGQEIEAGKGHALPRELVHRDQVTAWCDDKLRIEAQFNARYLKDRGLDLVCNWKMDTPAVLHSEHLSKLQLSGDMKLQPDQIETLPTRFRTAYLAWAGGDDLRSSLPARTFFRYRKELLAHGIDIAVAPPNAQRNVVPLIRYIEATPVGIPDFALGTELYFEPRRTA